MPSARIIRSRSADNDLSRIWEYTAREASPEVADFVIARLFEAINRASEHPFMYPQTGYRGRPRRINVFDYAIFYEPLSEGDGIRLRRVIHGRRNLAHHLRRPER